ncbi:hypothetical protein [Gemmatimonas sp.]|uniref:hypothetical protein n=1 Tax=Gemmatimonas sp. TaxID=1962908 RepID=UPI0022C33D2B|nr:hypothetical protein [Gemmatimonas sp.]MCZ8206531.1 hypothetical protein [Gemmatimonas sp.]
MYPNGLLLTLAVRASPQAHDGTLPSTLVIPNQLPAGAGRLHIQLAVQGVAAPTLNSPNAAVPHTPVVSPAPVEPVLAAGAPPVSRDYDTPVPQDESTAEPIVVTAIALTPELEEFVIDRVAEDIDEAIDNLRDETLPSMIDECVEQKVSEAMYEHAETLESLESRIDDLEEREAGIDEDTFEDLRLDVLTLTGRVDQLNVLRDTIAELTATCAALTARVAQLEHAACGTPRDGETVVEEEG